MNIVDDIYQQFKDYFGEDKVDMQSYGESIISIDNIGAEVHGEDKVIIVYWPVVTVTNEYDESVEIWDLYSITLIRPDGKLIISPQFIRSTYDKLQWSSDYLHSHVRTIGKSRISKWHTSCLGSGPIINTIRHLQDTPDLDRWNLYCWELDKYVHVESLTGVPYKRLQNIGNTDNSLSTEFRWKPVPNFPITSDTCVNATKHLITYLLKNNILKYAYLDNKYVLAYDYVDFVITVSNAFIKYYNHDKAYRDVTPKEDLFRTNFLMNLRIINGKIYNSSGDNIVIESVVGRILFTFKNKEVKLQLKDFKQNYTSGDAILVNPDIINFITYHILKYVNLLYGNSKRINNVNEKFKIF